MKKKSTTYLLIIAVLSNLALNMAHPVTPMLIKKLDLPALMFGIFFATMSIGNFLGSPFFGSLSDNHGRVKYLIIGLLGYGISQLGFGFNSNPFIIVIFRFLGGFFVTSYVTTIMAYLTDITNKENRLKFIAYYSAATTIGGALGSLLGGVIGNSNYKYTFFVQFLLCIFTSLLIFMLMGETIERKTEKVKISLNNFSIRNYGNHLTKNIVLVIIIIMIFFFASTSYNSSINYYIESVLNLPPSFNGIFLSIAGIVGFLANLIVTPYLGKKFKDITIFKTLTLLLGISLILSIFAPNNTLFFICMILFVALASIHVPLQQSILTKMSKDNYGSIMGLLNSSKSIGMICGSLFAGFIFDFGNKLPFLVAGIILVIGFLLTLNTKMELNSSKLN